MAERLCGRKRDVSAFSREKTCLSHATALLCLCSPPSVSSFTRISLVTAFYLFLSILSRVVSLSFNHTHESTTRYTRADVNVLLVVNASLSPRIKLHLNARFKVVNDVEKRRDDDAQHSAMGDDEETRRILFLLWRR